MKYVLLGGAFDPPHVVHVDMLKWALDYTGADQGRWVPNWGHKYFGITDDKVTASAYDRLAMVKLLETDRMKAWDIEIVHRTSGQTIELLPLLPKEDEFSFIIGSDQLPRFHEWHGYEELLRSMRFLVFHRPGYPIKPLYPGMEVVGRITNNVSSTLIRKLIKQDKPIDSYVPSGVAEYIYTHGLYQEGIGLHKEGLKKKR